jgi:hypothetical protein
MVQDRDEKSVLMKTAIKLWVLERTGNSWTR